MWRLVTEVSDADVNHDQRDVNQDQKHREDAEKHVLNHRLHNELGLPENITYQISEHLCVTAKSLSNQQTYPMFLMY